MITSNVCKLIKFWYSVTLKELICHQTNKPNLSLSSFIIRPLQMDQISALNSL